MTAPTPHRPLVRRPVPVAALTAVAALVAPATAQWHGLPYAPANAVHGTDWYVAHDTGNGLIALSAIAPTWTTVSPAGATFLQLQDKALVTRESTTTVRGWSALHNASATQTVSANVVVLTDATAKSFVVLRDTAPGTNGVLHAYSAFTNTWASVSLALPPNPFGPWRTGTNTGAHADGTQLHAYTAHTGAWSTHTVQGSWAPSLAGVDYVAHYRNPTNDYLAFSALRGTWSVSPVMSTVVTPGSDPVVVAAPESCVFTVRVPDPASPSVSYRLAGYSARTGQWLTSPVSHGPNAYTSSDFGENLVRFNVNFPGATWVETFGAVTGWSQLAGPLGIAPGSDTSVVADLTAAQGTVHVRSALTDTGHASVTVPGWVGSVIHDRHVIVTAGPTPASTSVWGWSPRTGAFAGPVPQPIGTGVAIGQGRSVFGFVVQGSLGVGTTVQAFATRWGTWVAGPTVQPGHSWTMDGLDNVLVARQSFAGLTLLHAFDEHRNAWLPPTVVSIGASPRLGGNAIVFENGPGTWLGYSAQRGEWTSGGSVGVGQPNVFMREHLAWFVDANGFLRVFTTPGRAQAWAAWPNAPDYASGGPAGLAPTLGISLRGGPTEFALLYAALDRPPGPIAVPGILGALDLGPTGVVQVAAPGLFDADGVHVVRLQVAGVVPAGIELSLQLVTVDVTTGAITLHDRATSSFVF